MAACGLFLGSTGLADFPAKVSLHGGRARSHLRDLLRYSMSSAGDASANETHLLQATLKQALARSDRDCDLCSNGQDWLLLAMESGGAVQQTLSAVNALPGFHVTGDSKGLLQMVKQLYDTGTNLNERQKKSDPAWRANHIEEKHLLCSLQHVAKTLAVGDFSEDRTTVIGFKETLPVLAEMGPFLDEAFPCAKYIVEHPGAEAAAKNTSKFVDEHSKSSFMLKQPEKDSVVPLYNDMLSFLHVTGCRFKEIAKPAQAGRQTDEEHLRLGLVGRTTMSGKCRQDGKLSR